MRHALNWQRVRGALFQEARRRQIAQEKVERTLELLPKLLEICGDYSNGRKVARRLGSVLLGTNAPEFVVPTCPAYPNRSGRYHKVWTLGSGVSLLTRLHLPFLERIATLVPTAKITILVADFEGEDRVLRQSTGLTRMAFLDRVRRTAKATRTLVRPFGWNAMLFSEFMPTFLVKRKEASLRIAANPSFAPMLRANTLARADLYRLYDPHANVRRMTERTIKVAAEYLTFGTEAASRSLIVVNHTTMSLVWYLQTDVAFLQNPVRAY